MRIQLMKKIFKLLPLLLVIALGLFLRIRAATIQSFWGDETSIFTVSLKNSVTNLLLIKHWDKCHPQIYYLFLHFWQKISTNIVYLRFPSLLAFIPTIILVFKIAKKSSNSLAAHLSALFFAINHFFVNLGFQQKPYAFEMFFMMATIYSLQNLIKQEKISSKNNTFFIISASLAFYIDYSFVWLWGALGISIILMLVSKKITRKTTIDILKTYLVATGIMSLQIPIIISSIKEAFQLENYLGVPKYINARYMLAEFVGLTEPINLDWLIVFLINISGILLFKYLGKTKAILVSTLLISFLPVLTLSYLISQRTPIFLDRNLLSASFIFIFIPPLLIAKIKDKYLKTFFALILIIYSIYIFPISFALEDGFQGRDPWEKVHYVSQNSKPITLVSITDKDYALSSLRDFYFLGYYNGQEIIDFNEKWIKLEEIEGWKLNQGDFYHDNIIFLVDPHLINDEYGFVKNISKQICNNKTCYGPFRLQ